MKLDGIIKKYDLNEPNLSTDLNTLQDHMTIDVLDSNEYCFKVFNSSRGLKYMHTTDDVEHLDELISAAFTLWGN